jgi:hypothetical protein
MTKTPLIYRKGRGVVLLDPEYEVRVGIYDFLDQATMAWAAYMAQGRLGEGIHLTSTDEYVIDRYRLDSQPFITSKCTLRRT